MNALDLTAAQLWLPGQGLVPPHIRAAMKAVEEYDADLTIGRHEQTGEWVVLLKRGPEGQPFPIFGLGVELPPTEAIKKRLYESDVRRHGGKMMDQLQRAADARKKAERAVLDDATGTVAEHFDWAFRKEGKHPNPRIFIPKGVTS